MIEELMQQIILEEEMEEGKEESPQVEVQNAAYDPDSGKLEVFVSSDFSASPKALEKIRQEIRCRVPGLGEILFHFSPQAHRPLDIPSERDPFEEGAGESFKNIGEEALEKEREINLSRPEPPGEEEIKEQASSGEDKGTKKGKKVSAFMLQPCRRIVNLKMGDGPVFIEGSVLQKNLRSLKNGRSLLSFVVSDHSECMLVKKFLTEKQTQTLPESFSEGDTVKVEGSVVYDSYDRSNVLMAKRFKRLDKEDIPSREDRSAVKRIELHAHTKMSAMDGLPDARALVERAARWGHEAVAITDHGVVQAFPEAMSAGKKYGIKILYGMEGYLLNDDESQEKMSIDGEYVVFDLETTGLSAARNEIIEIGAARIKNRKIIDQFHSFVRPAGGRIPPEITQLTDITEDMVKDADPISLVLPRFLDYAKDAVLAAHNASFDMSFIRAACAKEGISFSAREVDTLYLSRVILKDLKRHKLNLVAAHLGISQEHHHRADDDARTTAVILLKFFDMLSEAGIDDVNRAAHIHGDQLDYKTKGTNHIILLARNLKGLENLYRLVSLSHLSYFYKKPRIPKSVLRAHREGLLIGGACQDGEIYQSLLSGKSEKECIRIASFYDYLEMQPLENNQFLVEEGAVASREGLMELNKKILSLAEALGKPVVATSDVHYLDPEEAIYRRIIMKGQGYKDVEGDGGLYLRTTDEMLEEFSYLGEDKAMEVVVTNPKKIADSIEAFDPIPKEKYPPEIPGSDETLRELCYQRAKEIYGDPLPQIVQARLERELNSIISNGYAVLYIIAHKLVAKSMKDGYVVGSRGSVGSSLAATMSGITEVNPLPPHYVCPNCRHSDFSNPEKAGCGVDLPDRVCPVCKTPYRKDGFDIPFEVFLGFEGDKEPDIDLNFAGEYQPVAHKYIEELFGKDHVFRAGTIGTVAAKTAYGFVMKYFEEKGVVPSKWEADRLARGCEGVKRTTGQHPGGIIIVPKANDIHQFCPVQHPANDAAGGIITTHFDYHSIDQNLLKLDILGHDGPSMIKMLKDITGVDPNLAPLKDEKVDSLFNDNSALGLVDDRFRISKGSLGIPEFGTRFVRQMLEDTKPKSFADLVRIAGLSHGTNVWLNNAQEFILDGTAQLKDVISVRDDILNFLRDQGVEASRAFQIMEKVRKGKGVDDESEELMLQAGVPQWYIESCRRIQYMFPKAHAVAYVMMSYRIAYFKVYYPQAFYAVFFTMKLSDFNAQVILGGIQSILERMEEIEAKGKDALQKEQSEYTILELALEMYCRGYSFLPVRLYESDALQFKVVEDQVLLPFAALNGLGENAARALWETVRKNEFLSIDELQKKSGLNKTAISALKEHGVLEGLPSSNQLSFF